MRIHSAKPTRQHTLPPTPTQLSLQHIKSPISLCFIARKRIFIPHRIIMTIPIELAQHRSQRTNEKELPLIEIDVILFRRIAAGALTTGAQLVGLVVDAQEVMDDGAALPGYDAGVQVLEGWHAAVRVDVQEVWAFDAVGGVTEFPQFDCVWEIEGGEDYGYLVRVGTCAVG